MQELLLSSFRNPGISRKGGNVQHCTTNTLWIRQQVEENCSVTVDKNKYFKIRAIQIIRENFKVRSTIYHREASLFLNHCAYFETIAHKHYHRYSCAVVIMLIFSQHVLVAQPLNLIDSKSSFPEVNVVFTAVFLCFRLDQLFLFHPLCSPSFPSLLHFTLQGIK